MTDLRHRIARAIHRYDAEHAFSVNDLPSEHHYGEADAVLAVLADHDRDAARQTTPAGPCGCGAPATPDVVHCQGAPCYMDLAGSLQTVELPTAAARQTTGQDDTAPAPWTTDGRHGPTPEEASAAIGQCGKWGGCILDAGHTGLHRHTPRPADVEPYDHPGAAPAVGQPAEAHDTDSSVRNVIEHALTAYYQDSSAPSAVARAILAQHRIETLREAAETFRTEAAETATAAQENYDPDMAREAKRLNVMAARLDRMAVEDER